MEITSKGSGKTAAQMKRVNDTRTILRQPILLIAVILTIWSFADYLWKNKDVLKESPT